MEYIEAVIDRIEGNYAILLFDDKQTLSLPLEKLPPDFKEGMVLHVTFFSDKESEKNREELAKQILNDIINDAK